MKRPAPRARAVLTLRRLSASSPADVLSLSAAFRGTPSYVYATAGRKPNDQEIRTLMNTLPLGHTAESVFIFEIQNGEDPIGFVRGMRIRMKAPAPFPLAR